MTSIFVAEKKSDKSLFLALRHTLGQCYEVVSVCGRIITVPSQDAQVLVSDLDSFISANSDNTIFVFKDIQNVAFEPAPEGNNIAVVDSQSSKLIAFVSATQLPAITCGLSPKDTITLSSIDVDSAVINLQRAITCFDDTVAEPQEIPVRLGGTTDSFTIMATAAVFILNGGIEQLSQISL